MYRITQVLSVGPFASLQRGERLRAAGVTHILNVASDPNELIAELHGFKEIVWLPLSDSVHIPNHAATEILDTVHRMVSEPGSHVYVHCAAGQLRSPNVIWLYLIAVGISADEARDWIEERSPLASPGDRRLIGPNHVLMAQKHGFANFTHTRPEIIVPFETALPRG